MLDIKWIRANPDKLDESLSKRGIDSVSKSIIHIDSEKRALISLIQKLQHERKEKSSGVVHIYDKSSTDFEEIQNDVKLINQKITELETSLLHHEKRLSEIMDNLPNLVADDVPYGTNSDMNKVLKECGTIQNIKFPKHHYEIGKNLGMMDFNTATKMSGSRFVILKHDLAKLERALINFMIDVHTTEFNFFEVSPPCLVKDHAMYNVGQLPKFADASFETTTGYRLIPTAEVPLTNIFANTTLLEEKLPIRLVAFTPCFRSEVGSAGKDVKGMLRMHQFGKVELFTIATPEESNREFEYLTAAAEKILEKLGLPYRVVLLCSGDIGFAAHKTYDLEVWLPAQNCYREISSCSHFSSFQARRSLSKYRELCSKKVNFLHTINGSGLAVGRTIIAILENYQNSDGSVTIPEKLRNYMGGQKLITPLTETVF